MAADNADRERWGALFAKLDANKDGKIEVSELAAALRDQIDEDAEGFFATWFRMRT